jgi:prephenate dehydrogenase
MSEIERVAIIGTGLIGASVGLALKSLHTTSVTVVGWDDNPAELEKALQMGALDEALIMQDVYDPDVADVFVLATPVLPILDWMQKLAPGLHHGQLVTDVGSTKREITALAAELFNQPGQARFLAGHPMAGKESGGAALAESTLFRGATWLFCPAPGDSAIEAEWRATVTAFGAHIRDIDADRHDAVCAWVSHLPQMVSTAMSAMLQDEFAGDMGEISGIGGRALREMTRLGASPYSMWRDVAMTNTENVAATLWALEQRLAHLRENLKTPGLREEFSKANAFRAGAAATKP